MSTTLDKLTPEEEAELRQMQADDLAAAATEVAAAPEPTEAAEPPTESTEAAEPSEAAEPADKPGLVDKRALDAERERRRKAEAERNELQQKHAADMARVEERLRLLADAAQQHVAASAPKPPDPEPEPDFSTDPAGFIQYSHRVSQQNYARTREDLNELRSLFQQGQKQTQEQAQNEALRQWGVAQEEEFRRVTPDYGEAMAHLKASRERILRSVGVTDPVVLQAGLNNEVMQSAAAAYQRGIPFGKMLYDLAQAHGYQPGAVAAAPAASPAAVPVQQARAAPTAAERLIRGQDMAVGLGSTGGAPRGELAPAAIANMSEHEFEALYAKVKKNGAHSMRELFGH